MTVTKQDGGVPVTDRLVLFIKAIVGGTYDFFFGWLDRKFARQNEGRLVMDVRRALPSLFTEHRGTVIPNEGVPFPPGFDYAFVTVSAGRFLLRFVRGRGELGVSIAPVFAPNDWHDLIDVVRTMDPAAIQRPDFGDLTEVAKILEPRLGDLAQIYSKDP